MRLCGCHDDACRAVQGYDNPANNYMFVSSGPGTTAHDGYSALPFLVVICINHIRVRICIGNY